MTDLRIGLAWALAARGRTSRAARRLLLTLEEPEKVLALSPGEAAGLAGEPLEAVLPLLRPESVTGVDRQVALLSSSGARLVGLWDAEYPHLLAQITDPPIALFVRGAAFAATPAVAIVGSRQASRTGLEVARRLAADLAGRGVAIVSGFARGIDGAAHRGALEAGGTTHAVLGCGVDVRYPADHDRLVPRVLERGTLLSEHPMGTSPQPFHFPIRNRIIAGLVPIVVVVEAAARSGSLITARHAADFGRDVGAVPGSVLQDGTAGSNALLKDGAILVRDASDVLAELAGFRESRATREPEQTSLFSPAGLDPDAAALLSALDPDEPADGDALAAATGLSPARLSAAIVILELEGLVEPLPGAVFVRRRGGA